MAFCLIAFCMFNISKDDFGHSKIPYTMSMNVNRLSKIALAAFVAAVPVVMDAAEKLTGTPIGTSQDVASAVFDGDASSSYRASKASYAWVGLDLGEAHVITRVGWMAAAGVSSKSVVLGMFQGANNADFSDAVPIYLNTESGSNGRMDYGEVDCSRGFRYVRYVGPSDSYCSLAELEFYGDKGAGDDSRLWQITNLPTVVINTVNDEIPYDKEHEISSTVIIISKDGSDVLEKSETGIRERGNGSRQFPKKPWRLKFDKKQNVLDAPAKAKKWTLINNYGDKTLMRNMLAFDIARKAGMAWVPYCQPVDVVLNGEYKGCYQLCDQVEVNPGRLEIDEMEPTDIEGEALTGGYFFEIDAYAPDELSWFRSAHYGIPVTIKSPKDDEIVPAQKQYITDYFNTLENKMKDTDPVTGYRSMFDNESFIQHMLVNEVAGNTDAYWSTYMYKKRGNPVIYTGPVWDFDLGFDNDIRVYHVYERSGNSYLWDCGSASAADGMRYFAQRILLKDPLTKDEIFSVWDKARRNGLSAEWLKAKVDEYAELLDASQKLNFTRWPILWQRVHQNPVALGSYAAECEAIKNYADKQMEHLDKVIGFDPSTLPDEPEVGIEGVGCDAVTVPVEYFTLQGVKVSNPVLGGIYIMRRGNEVTKVFVK